MPFAYPCLLAVLHQFFEHLYQDLTDLYLRASVLKQRDPVLGLVIALLKYGPARDAVPLERLGPDPVQPAELYNLLKAAILQLQDVKMDIWVPFANFGDVNSNML